jgi:AraC-like DNA-binding protein
MPGSRTSVFGGLAEFEDALRSEGVLGQLMTEQGQFRARLTQVALHHLYLAAGEEQLSRIALIEVPPATVLVSLAVGEGPSPIWGGVPTQRNEIVTIGPGERLYARTDGPCRWNTIRAPLEGLLRYGRAVSGTRFAAQHGIAQWRPAGRDLHRLHRAAIRTAEGRSATLADPDAAYGLEQQLLHALIECLTGRPTHQETAAGRRRRDLVTRFEALLQEKPFGHLNEISAALGVSPRLLRECCRTHLGLSPRGYRRRRAMQQVHLALRSGAAGSVSVSAVAQRNGFRDLGRFAGRYRALYGELPSATLRRAGADTAGRPASVSRPGRSPSC